MPLGVSRTAPEGRGPGCQQPFHLQLMDRPPLPRLPRGQSCSCIWGSMRTRHMARPHAPPAHDPVLSLKGHANFFWFCLGPFNNDRGAHLAH